MNDGQFDARYEKEITETKAKTRNKGTLISVWKEGKCSEGESCSFKT